MSGTERHVRPHPKGGWEVRAPGASRTSGRFEDSASATQRARDIVARQGGGRVLVHDAGGLVVQTITVEARAKATETKAGDGRSATVLPDSGRQTDVADPDVVVEAAAAGAPPPPPDPASGVAADMEGVDPKTVVTSTSTAAGGVHTEPGGSEEEDNLVDPELFVDATATTRLPSFAEEQDEFGAEPVDGAESAAPGQPERTGVGDGAGRSDGSLAGLAAKTATDVKELVAAEARLIKAGLQHELRRLVVNGGAVGAIALLEWLGHGRRGGRNKLRSSR